MATIERPWFIPAVQTPSDRRMIYWVVGAAQSVFAEGLTGFFAIIPFRQWADNYEPTG